MILSFICRTKSHKKYYKTLAFVLQIAYNNNCRGGTPTKILKYEVLKNVKN